MDGRRKASAGRQVSFRRRPLPFCLVLGAGLLYASLARALQSAAPIFHTVREVHTLSAEEAARHYPVHLDHAQITYFQPSFGALFLMDRTDGIYANFNRGEEPAVMAGDIVAVDGVTGPGDVAPVLLRAHFRVLGHAPLPAAPTVSFDRLGTGGFDSRWVGVEGIVRSVDRPRRRTNYDGHTTFDSNNVVMTLASGDQRLEVIILDRGPWDPGRLVDAKVRVRGAIGSRFNQRNQLIGVHLYMPSPSCIDVLEAAPEDPFARRLTGITAITRMGSEEPGHRVHIRGVVTSAFDGRHLSVMDSEHGIFVTTENPTTVGPGDRVDVSGFPSIGDYTDVLDSAAVRRMGTAPLPTPARLTPSQAMAGSHDAELIEVEGILTELSVAGDGTSSLRLTDGTIDFHGVISPSGSGESLRNLQLGSRLRVRGICVIHTSFDKTPESFDVLLRSLADVRVLRRPSWWNPRHAAMLATLLSAIVLVIAAWNLVLRRRVAAQTRQIQSQLEEADKLRIRAEAAHKEKSESLASVLSLQHDLLEAQEKLRHQATHDVLTGLWNRGALLDLLHNEIERSVRSHVPMGVLMLDVDHFKPVNDTLGHLAGDAVLKEMAQRIAHATRSYDIVGRYGGEEFLVILPGCNREETESGAERIRAAIATGPFPGAGSALSLTISIGAVVAPECAEKEAEILALADQALYQAKGAGRNCTVLRSSLEEAHAETAEV